MTAKVDSILIWAGISVGDTVVHWWHVREDGWFRLCNGERKVGDGNAGWQDNEICKECTGIYVDDSFRTKHARLEMAF